MPLKTNSRELEKSNGETSTLFVRQSNATESLEMLSELFHTCQTYIIPFIEGKATFADQARLLQVVSPTLLPGLIKKFALKARKDGNELKEAEFNIHYNGEMELLWNVFTLVCETNFKDFCTKGLESIKDKKVTSSEEQGINEHIKEIDVNE